MIQKLSQKILKMLIDNDAVAKGQEAIIEFGIEQGLRTGVSIVLMIFTGFVIDMLWQSVVILLCFLPIRIYAGGYHADTPLQCNVKSWVLFVSILFSYKYLSIKFWAQIMIIITTGISIYLLSPVQNENKPLKEYEIKKYRRKSIQNYCILVVTFCVAQIIRREDFAKCIVMALIMVFLMLILGEKKNRRANKV